MVTEEEIKTIIDKAIEKFKDELSINISMSTHYECNGEYVTVRVGLNHNYHEFTSNESSTLIEKS